MLPIQSMMKRTQSAKMDSAIAIIAMSIAKKNRDMNWVKASKAKKLLLASRANIMRKYGNEARREYMQSSSKAE
jgi:hypothetical protein